MTAVVAAGEVRACVRGLGVVRGGRTVLRGVDLELRAGSVHALVGPNGAGKSTVLAALGGDVAAAAGTVEVGGRPLAGLGPRAQARLRAVLLQQSQLSLPFTVAEVVAMGRRPWAGTEREDEDEDAVTEALARTGTGGFAARRWATLSGGEQARVSLARVLAQRTPVLLLDEPTAALDLRHQELVMTLARERAAAGVAVGVVLHDLGLAGAHCDRVTLLGDGAVVRTGTPAEVLRADLLSQVYRHPVEVLTHPRTGTPIVVAHR